MRRAAIAAISGLWLALLWWCAASHAQTANGVFLVAQPSFTGPVFSRTVILLTQPQGAGPMGIIINRPSDVRLTAVLPKHPGIAALPQPLYFGGPVGRQGLVFLVRSTAAPPRAMKVLDDLYLTGNADWIEAALASGDPAIEVRVYGGYADWARGQLQNEMQRNGWYIVPADSAAIFEGDLDKLWAELVRKAELRQTGG